MDATFRTAGGSRTPFLLRAGPALLAALLMLCPVPGWAQEGDEDPAGSERPDVRMRNTSELSYLVSGGNSAASTLGFRNTFRRDAPSGDLRIDGQLLRTDATRFQRVAVGTPENHEVQEVQETERTAERYAAEVRYDLNLGSRPYATGSVGWQRNTFAGFRGRTVITLGGGTRWTSEDRWDLKLGGGFTYTFQTDVEPDPDRDHRFGGVRLTLDHERELRGGTTLEVKWVADANAEDWDDVRGDLVQAVTADLTSRLALKTTLQLLVDNDPPFTRVPLVVPDGADTGETVRYPLRKVDRLLSVAFVISL